MGYTENYILLRSRIKMTKQKKANRIGRTRVAVCRLPLDTVEYSVSQQQDSSPRTASSSTTAWSHHHLIAH